MGERRRLTDRYVATVTGKREVADEDTRGLVLRVGKHGEKSWTVVFRVHGMGGTTPEGRPLVGPTARLGLGRYPDVSLSEARRKAAAAKAKARAGVEPRLEAREEARERFANSVEMVLGRMVKRDEKRGLRASTMANQQHAIDKDIVPELGHHPIATLDRRTVSVYLDKIEDSKGKSAAQESRKTLSKLMNFALDEGYVQNNPWAGMKRPALGYNQGERALSLDEARKVYAACDELGAYGPAVKLILLTALRKSNVFQAQWSWVDMEKREIVIPAEHYKGKREFRGVLVDQAVEILDSVPRWNQGDYIFSHTSGRSHTKTAIATP